MASPDEAETDQINQTDQDEQTRLIEEAVQRLREQRTKAADAAARLRAQTASVTSKDRMVTARVGARGEVVSMTFHTDGYRTMSQTDFAAVLLDVLNRARAEMGERTVAAMRSLTGLDDLMRLAPTGPTDLGSLLASLTSMRPQAPTKPIRIAAEEGDFDA